MDNFDSEKEQLEQIKTWLRENGLSIVLGIVLGLGGVYGWRGWQGHKVSVAEEYSASLASAEQHLEKANYQQAAVEARQLIEDGDGTLYAELSRLVLARAEVEQGKLDEGALPLQEIVADKESVFNTVARIRLAKIYIAQSRFDEAEKLVTREAENAYAAVLEELRGDIEFGRGEYVAARTAYLNAISLAGANAGNQFLQMKIDAVPVAE